MKKQSLPNNSSRRLLLLLGISLLLHGMLLSYWPTSKPLLEFDYQLQNLAISLEPIEILGQQKPARKEVDAISKARSVTQSTVLADKSATNKQPTQDALKNHVDTQPHPANTAVQANNPAMNRARILSQIRHDLSQYFYYPPLARRKGMQGTVLLGFGISRQGVVRNIRIVKSSGYAMLDMAAQDAMQRLEKLNWYAAAMHGKDIDLELPVIFRLTEG